MIRGKHDIRLVAASVPADERETNAFQDGFYVNFGAYRRCHGGSLVGSVGGAIHDQTF